MHSKVSPFSILKAGYEKSALAQMVVSLAENKISYANEAALAFLKCRADALSKIRFTSLFHDDYESLHIFTEAILTYHHAYSRSLPHPLEPEVKVEYYGIHCPLEGKSYIHLTIFNLDDFHKRQVDSEADNYQRQGYEEWRRVERFFREIELQNQMILKAAGEGIYGVNAEGITIFVNQAAEEMLGWTESELVGHDMHSRVHFAHPDGSHYHNEDCPIYAAFRLGKVTHVDDEVFWRKDGSAIQVDYTSTPIIDNGDNIGAVIVFRDVTQRRHREEQLRLALEENARLRNRLEQENAYLQEEIRIQANASGIIGKSPAIQHIHKQIDLAAPTDASILVTGESGTGKELIAHALHEASRRSKNPMIRVNCAAIPRELFESEFFGHAKGSFTGAWKDRVGRFELADGGTLFLDEVGEIPLELQSKLLRVLQEQEFERVGEDRTRSADVRLICATNRDLKKEVEKGHFREDLYFRLNVFPIDCAPLRKRREDIPLLAEHFLKQASERLNIAKPSLTVGNINALKAYDWPGNVRELQNVIERAAILATKGRMVLTLPQIDFSDQGSIAQSVHEGRYLKDHDDHKILTVRELAELEKENIKRALAKCHGRVSGPLGAAALLNVKPTTLYSKINKLGLK